MALEGNITNVHGRLKYWANVHPHSEAFVFIDKDGLRTAFTCQQILNEAEHFARQLIKLGIKRGDVICSWLTESQNGIIAFFGIILAGGVFFDGKLQTTYDSFLIQNINKTKSTLLILPSDTTNEYNSFFSKLLEHQDCHKVSSDTLPYVTNAVYTNDNGDVGFKWAIMETATPEVDAFCYDGNSDAVIILTSGTTGLSKMVVHSQLALVSVYDSLDMTSHSGSLNYYSLNWGPGLPTYYFKTGLKTVTLDQGNNSPCNKLKQLYDIVIKENCDNLSLRSDELLKMVELVKRFEFKREWPKNIECFFTAHALSQSLFDVVKPYFATVYNFYGSTEALLISYKKLTKQTEFKDFNTGISHYDSKIIVKDDNNVLLPKAKSGNIYVKTKYMFKRYLGDEKLTSSSFDDNGYFNTGDLGYVNECGELIVYGRKKEVIVRGDDYFHPIWIERVIRTCSEVKDVLVVKVPDAVFGDEICACVVLVEGSQYDSKLVEKYCQEMFLPTEYVRISPCPKYFIILEKIPLNRNGKPDRIYTEKYASNFLKL